MYVIGHHHRRIQVKLFLMAGQDSAEHHIARGW
jgi:hypothetical protein